MKRQEAEAVINKACVKEVETVIEETTTRETKKRDKKSGYKNCAGYNARSLNLKANVKQIAIKCYDEQMPKGWEYVKMKLRNLDRHKFQVVAICHDSDTVEDSDFFKPAIEKRHYHILIRFVNPNGTLHRSGTTVNCFLKGTGIVFRPCDVTLIANHGIETVENWCGYVLYLTHETEKAFRDGKHIYDRDDVVSNLTKDEVDQFREGYTRVSAEQRKLSKTDIAEIAKTVYELGYGMKDFYEWYKVQPALVQSHSKMNYWKTRYEDGVKDYIKENGKYVNRLCIYIQGKTNVGKTRTTELALYDMGYKNIESVGGGGTGKYDDITCTTEAIVLDDDRTDNALHLTQSEIVKAYKRGKGNPYWTGKMLVVTSNKPFEEWAYECNSKYNEEEVKALRSRFYVCETVKAGSKTRLKCETVSDRGKEDEQLERYELYKKFRDTFHKKIDEYVKPKNINYDDLNDFGLSEEIDKELRNWLVTAKAKLEVSKEYVFANRSKVEKAKDALQCIYEKIYDSLVASETSEKSKALNDYETTKCQYIFDTGNEFEWDEERPKRRVVHVLKAVGAEIEEETE